MQNKSQKKMVGRSYLIPESELTLYTRNAQYYIRGRMPGVLSLFQFNKILRQLNRYAAKDNPYARWILWQIHDQLHQACYELQRLQKRYRTMLKGGKNKRNLAIPKKPVIFTLRGVPVYTFMAGDMISEYDAVLSMILIAKFTGLTLDKPFATLEQNLKQIIEPVLNIPNQWKAIDVTREDLQKNNKIARQACELMGELPSHVLSGEMQAEHAPSVKK